MGKKEKTKLATWGYIMCTHTLFCHANSTDDNANNKVLDTFPAGTIGFVNDDNGTIVLNPKYRTVINEFHYYISRMLAAIFPTYTTFSQQKSRDLLSDIYSVTDKAFGLLVIYNKHQVWKDQEEMKRQGNKGKTIKKRKRFCSGNSGNRKGWPDTGMKFFSLLCHQVVDEQRKQERMVRYGHETFQFVVPSSRNTTKTNS